MPSNSPRGPEGHERAGAREPDHLPLEHLVGVPRPTARAGSSGRCRRHRARSTSPRARAPSTTGRPSATHDTVGRRPVAGHRRQQRAVADQVGVAPDRRGEVAVAGQLQAGVPAVALVVVGLLERAQDQAGQGAPAPPALATRSRLRSAARPHRSARPPAAGRCAPWAPAASAPPARPVGRSAAPPRSRRAARARGTARARAVRSRNWATCSLAAIIRCSIIRCDSVCSTARIDDHVAAVVELELGLGRVDLERAPATPRRSAERGRGRPRARPAPGPQTADAQSRNPRRCGRPGRSRAARRSGSPSGRTRAAHPVAVDHHLDGHREAILSGDERARVVRQRPGSIGSTAPGT